MRSLPDQVWNDLTLHAPPIAIVWKQKNLLGSSAASLWR